MDVEGLQWDRQGRMLCLAAATGNVDVVRGLCAMLGPPSADAKTQEAKVFQIAVKKGYLEVVRALCEVPSSRSAQLFEAVGTAAQEGHLAIVRYLWELQQHEDPSACRSAAIWKAARNGHVDVVRYLWELPLEWGSDPIDTRKCLVAMAAQEGHVNIARYLCEVPMERDVDVYDALREAIRNGHTEVVCYFCARIVAKRSITRRQVHEAIRHAVRAAKVDVLQCLCAAFPDYAAEIGLGPRCGVVWVEEEAEAEGSAHHTDDGEAETKGQEGTTTAPPPLPAFSDVLDRVVVQLGMEPERANTESNVDVAGIVAELQRHCHRPAPDGALETLVQRALCVDEAGSPALSFVDADASRTRMRRLAARFGVAVDGTVTDDWSEEATRVALVCAARDQLREHGVAVIDLAHAAFASLEGTCDRPHLGMGSTLVVQKDHANATSPTSLRVQSSLNVSLRGWANVAMYSTWFGYHGCELTHFRPQDWYLLVFPWPFFHHHCLRGPISMMNGSIATHAGILCRPLQPTPPAYGEWFDYHYRHSNPNAHRTTGSKDVCKKETESVGTMTEA